MSVQETAEWMLEQLAPTRHYTDADTRRRARILSIVALLVAIVGGVRGTLLFLFGIQAAGVGLLAASVVGPIVALWVHRGAQVYRISHIVVALLFMMSIMEGLSRGGLGSPALIGPGIAILLAILLAGRLAGLVWAAMTVISMLTLYVLQSRGLVLTDRAMTDWRLLLDTSASIAIPLVIFGLASAYEWTKNAAMTERLEAERDRQLAQLDAALARADRLASIGVLSSGVGHEINNPLSCILSNLELISDAEFNRGLSESERRQMLDDVYLGAQQISSVIKDLLRFSRKEEAVAEEALDVTEALDMALALVRVQTSQLNIQVDMATASHVRGNRHRLVQVFVNLLINACHACKAQQESGEIVIRGRLQGTDVRVVIVDNGTGIPSDLISHIFKPFFTTKPAGSGTGLGLAVAVNILREMDGEIQVESRPGRTAFTIIVPACDTTGAALG